MQLSKQFHNQKTGAGIKKSGQDQKRFDSKSFLLKGGGYVLVNKLFTTDFERRKNVNVLNDET